MRPLCYKSGGMAAALQRVLAFAAMRKLLLAFLLLALPTFAREVLPFIENDYAKALARAKTKGNSKRCRPSSITEANVRHFRFGSGATNKARSLVCSSEW